MRTSSEAARRAMLFYPVDHAKLGEGVDHRFRQPVNDRTSPGSSVSQKRKPALLPILTAGAGRFLLAD
jgi:hypothetical protein